MYEGTMVWPVLQWCVILSLLVSGCERRAEPTVRLPALPTPCPLQLTAEEQAVYSAAAARWLEGSAPVLVVVSRISSLRRRSASVIASLPRNLPEGALDAAYDYIERNDARYALDRGFPLQFNSVFLDPQETDNLFVTGGEGWEGFSRRYPMAKGLISVSRVGFDNGHMYAFLEVGEDANYAGHGAYMVLAKHDGNWSVEDVVPAWIS